MAVDFTSIFQHTNYTIEQVIGEGGMAIVYLGEHKAMKRPVAIKFLLPEYVIIENIRKRFIAEGKNMFSMNHSNIVRVIDLIDQPDMVAIVMEYVPGNSLKVMIEKYGALEDDEIKEFFPQMLDAVAYVHAQNLIHRDIKPSNFMISADGSVKLFDFGIAKNQQIENVEHTATGTNQTLGTPLYMSPEQVKETRNVSHHTDIYSLGVVLWQMVKGIRPYGSNTSSLFEIQTKIVNEPLERTGTVWDRIIQKATEKEPEKRYKDCASMLKDFNNLSEDHSKSAPVLEYNTDEETMIGQTEIYQTEKVNQEPPSSEQVIANKNESISQLNLIDSLEKYNNEHKFNFGLLILFSILMLPFGFFISFIYTLLIHYIPFIYANFLITCGFGVVIGFIYPIKLTKCTNSKVAIFNIVIFALICHYFGWCVWGNLILSEISFRDIISLFVNPSVLFDTIKIISIVGHFSIASYEPSGYELYLIWIIELFLVLFFAAFTVNDRCNQPFSFKQNKWFSSSTLKLSYITNIEYLIHAIISGNYQYFSQLSKYEEGKDYSEIEIWHLENEPAYLTIKNFEKKTNENGKSKFEETEIIKYVKVDNAIRNTLIGN